MNLKELSRLLGLSPTTVSRALNGYPEVSPRTRDRVIAAARRHGYAPNQVAKRLATGRAMAIGHVIPLADHEMINPIFADFVAGAGEIYSAMGYDMVLSIVPKAEEARAYRDMRSHHKVDGVIVHGPARYDLRIDLLQGIGLPFLVHGRDGRAAPDYPWLDINNRRGFLRATDYLIGLGHRRIGLLNGPEDQHFAHRRRRGYEDALAAAGIAVDPALILSGEMTEPFGAAGIRTLLTRPDPPTAVLCASILIARGVALYLAEAGLTIGADVSVLTHDDDLSFLSDRGDRPRFTATRSSIRAAGRRAAEMLIGLITRPQAAPRQELWEVDFVHGRSTGPPVRRESRVHA